jgi:hypothetical protein
MTPSPTKECNLYPTAWVLYPSATFVHLGKIPERFSYMGSFSRFGFGFVTVER